jgi:hypothetical protein
MTPWALIANRVLFELAYRDDRRRGEPMGKYPKMPPDGWGRVSFVVPTDDWLLRACLACKRDLVLEVEEALARGEAFDALAFVHRCQEDFEAVMGTAPRALSASGSGSCPTGTEIGRGA